MDVLGDVVDRERRTDLTALRAQDLGRSYDLRRFCTTTWKVGNFLSHLGVRNGSVVGIADDPVPEVVLTFYGAGLLGAVVRFDPPTRIDDADGVRALVAPAADLDAYDVGPRTKRVAYGDPPDDPGVAYFERDVWSQNPTTPPDPVSKQDPVLETEDRRFSHRDLLAAAERAIADLDAGPGDDVIVRGSFANPGVVAAGLVAAVMVGATAVIGPNSAGEYVVGGADSDIDVKKILEP